MSTAFSEGPDYWSHTEVALPARSRLFHLEPAGVGTGVVEGLASYSSRLAAAHNVTHASLFGREISPLIDRKYLRNSESKLDRAAILAASFRSVARAVNGSGITARDYAGALEELTGRDNLRCLTMATWANVIPHRGLLKPSKAWCPSCFEEFKTNTMPVYEPLIWSLSVVSYCVKHRRRLRLRCPHCDRFLPHLDSHSKPGFCSKCNSWLGRKLAAADGPPTRDVDSEEVERQTWAAGEVGALLASSPLIKVAPEKKAVTRSIELCIKNIASMTESCFARAVGIPQTTVNDWQKLGKTPELQSSLAIARYTQIPLLKILLGTIPPASFGVASPASKHLVPTGDSFRHRKRQTRIDIEAIRIELESALNAEITPSPKEIARNLPCSPSTLAKHFPVMCKELSEKYKQSHAAGQSKIEAGLESALIRDPPQPIKIIAKDLGRHRASLYRHFPRLCRLIAQRYELYRHTCREQSNQIFLQEIREIVIGLHSEGVYPSVKRVEARLRQHRTIRYSKMALATLHEVREECGIPKAPNNFARSTTT